ncbi:MAG: hypothetical protein H0V79_08800 [Actinobacteria bacterium]|nr:hypothetical protein [Actinomycetota bacterium]
MLHAPQLHHALRSFCLGAFAAVTRELDEGGDVPFAFEEHEAPGRPTLYEYRPLVRPFLEARANRLTALPDVRDALEALEREPAAAIFARAHGDGEVSSRDALLRTVLLPLLAETAEACGGFDWDDEAFERSYAVLEGSLFGESRSYAAVAPVVGLSIGGALDLGGGVRIRHVASGEIAAHWPQARGLLPEGFEREPDRLCVLELQADLDTDGGSVPDAPGELADAVTALRLATAGPVAAGPVLFERLDWKPYGIRAVLPIAATAPPGEPVRLDPVTADRALRLRERLALADHDRELGEALDRWELALFQSDPFASEQLRASLTASMGGVDGLFAGSLRAAAALGETPRERAGILERLRLLAAGDAGAATADLVRRALVAVLEHGDRQLLLRSLDETLLGLRPKPAIGLESLVAAGAV